MTSNHQPMRRVWQVLAIVAISAFSAHSHAQYEATAYAPNGNAIGHTTTPGDVTYTYGGTGNSASISFTASPVASVAFAALASNAVGQAAVTGGGIMTYSFEVAAQPFTSVPIDFTGLFSSSVSSTPMSIRSSADTSFVIQTLNSSQFTYASFSSLFYNSCATTCVQFTTYNDAGYTVAQLDETHVKGSFEGTLDMLTGADGKVKGSVQLFAGGAANVFPGTTTVTSFIDPHLEIDAAFLAAHPGAALTVTPGVGNQIAVVPEPGTYAMMLVGFAVVGGASRRRARAQR